MKKALPIPRIAAALEQEWAEELAARAGVATEAFLSSPSTHMSYPSEGVRLELMDGLVVEFKYAFALVKPEWHAIAVFTEHCGHHVYPNHEARVYQEGALVFSDDAAQPTVAPDAHEPALPARGRR